DDEKALDAYIKEKGYHNDPAWQKQRELIDRLKKEKEEGALSDEDKQRLEDLKTVTSSREYIQASMEKQGYTQEAINNALKEKGFDIPDSKVSSDFDLVVNTLKIDAPLVISVSRILIPISSKHILFFKHRISILSSEPGSKSSFMHEQHNPPRLISSILPTFLECIIKCPLPTLNLWLFLLSSILFILIDWLFFK
ncbi:MAG: hypothetical protein KJ717_07875, partial [Proteobacteria bacterium]|nr:hypothetical protein [Pseudomonadota bacterium]